MTTESSKSAAQVLAELPLGRIDDEDIDFYHDAPAVSVSKMKVFRHSPALYQWRFVSGTIEKPEATPALLFGSACGALILEGRAVFDSQYYVVPKGIGRQKAEHKNLRAELAAANPGTMELSFDEAEKIEAINKKVRGHRFAGQLIEACKPEITWRVKGHNFHMQVRTDGWSDEGCELTQGYPFIADLKTIPEIPDDEPEALSRQITDFWYHGQDFTYREIVSSIMKYPPEFRPRFFFIFAEKNAPFRVQVVELDELARECADKQVRDTMERMAWCHINNRWPDTWTDTWQDKVPSVGLPQYYLRREMGEDRMAIW